MIHLTNRVGALLGVLTLTLLPAITLGDTSETATMM